MGLPSVALVLEGTVTKQSACQLKETAVTQVMLMLT
jgi:hypothetical protein